MKLRTLAIVGGGLLLLVCLGLFLGGGPRKQSAPPSVPAPPASPTASSPATPDGAANPLPPPSPVLSATPIPRGPSFSSAPLLANRLPGSVPPAAVAPPARGSESEATLADLEKISLMLRDYRTLFGGNPVGTNAEIMKAINGGNPKGAKLGPPEGMSLNDNRELIDRWGTPIFFHQISATHMEIWSAGPDKRLGTADDLFLK